MAVSRSHKITGKRLAKKFDAEYKPEKIADITTSNIVIVIVSPDAIKEGIRALQGYKKPVYIAGINQEAVDQAIKDTKNTTVGVMDNKGTIVKDSSRKSKTKGTGAM